MENNESERRPRSIEDRALTTGEIGHQQGPSRPITVTRAPLKASDVRRCFYVPGQPGILDAVNPVTGRGLYGGRTLADYQRTDPGAVEEDFDVACKASDDLFRAPPSEITEVQWMDALEVLPPVAWTRDGDGETFKLSERTSGSITAIFCQIGGRYFTLSDDITLPHAEIVERCRKAVTL